MKLILGDLSSTCVSVRDLYIYIFKYSIYYMIFILNTSPLNSLYFRLSSNSLTNELRKHTVRWSHPLSAHSDSGRSLSLSLTAHSP